MELLTQLYQHQSDAIEKLINVKVGALYMEQGTGKTRTALELIKRRLDAGKINHVIWLCPCSVKENLKRDLTKHAGNAFKNVITICGIETLSSSVKWNVELLDIVKRYKCYLIVDESNLVKNHNAHRTKNIVRLSELCQYKLILNGTPIARNEADLFSQWYVLDPRILGYKSYWSFAANHLEYDEFGRLRRCLNVDYLTEKIAPYTFQVKKSECLDLPEKTYETYFCDLSEEQRDHYNDVADDLLIKVNEYKPETIYRLFTGLQNVISGFAISTQNGITRVGSLYKSPQENLRIKCLLNILDKINDDEKVMIFCKYTQEIDDIYNILNEQYGANTAVRFDGSVSQKERQGNIVKFEDTSRFFVANKTCAGYGLNLQFCSYIIFYSNDWDYATRAQAEDRVHRIGQNKNVHIIDICAMHTLDAGILRCLRNKENLADSFKKELMDLKDKTVMAGWANVKRKKTTKEGN